VNADETYWALQLNQHAVQLALTAPYNTIQLTAISLNAHGEPLTVPGTVHYSTADSTVTVDQHGLVTARYVSSSFRNALVVAALTDSVHHLTLVDTCFIQVTATSPASPLATFTIQPGFGATAMMPVDQSYTIRAMGTDAGGNSVKSFPYFTSSDPNIAQIDRLNGQVVGRRTGDVTLYATTWSYGVAKRDSLAFSVVIPSQALVSALPVTPTGSTQPVLTFWPQIVTIGAGGYVTWINKSYTDSIDVVFDDSMNVDSISYNNLAVFGFGTGEGNIPAWVQDPNGTDEYVARFCRYFGGTPPNCSSFVDGTRFAQARQRKFPVPGTYHYHSTKWAATGTIIVQ
jgi:hypothetical protein